MGRKPRVEQEGGIYHVIQRGNNREFIFGGDIDKEYLLELFRPLCEVAIVYGYVIMGNHYHLILRTSSEPLQTIMHQLNLRYSKYFNREHGRSGHVFQGRYKAILVRDESYMLSLLRYVHQNPVRSELCRRVEEYRWSSDSFYRENKNDWVEVGLVLELLSGNMKTAVEKYMEFMAEEEHRDYESASVIGETESRSSSEREKKKSDRGRLDEILMSTGVSEQEFNLIKSGSRIRNLSGYKLAYASKALNLNYTMKAIGDNIKVSDVAILNMLRRNNVIS